MYWLMLKFWAGWQDWYAHHDLRWIERQRDRLTAAGEVCRIEYRK